jgi:hypothetical protein
MDYTDFPRFLKRRTVGYTSGMEHAPTPRNLLSHFDQTLAAMAELETPEWTREQGPDEADRHRQNLANALAWLRDPRGSRGPFIVTGWGGVNRWAVHRDGTVVFLLGETSKAGTSESAARAASLGFRIVNDKRLTG